MCGIVEMKDYINKARFLYGESMGGAVVLHIHRKEPQEWNGAILQAPMCKVQFHLISSSILLSELRYADPRLFNNTTPASWCVSLDIQAHDIYDVSNSLPTIFDLAGTTSLRPKTAKNVDRNICFIHAQKPNARGCGRM